MPEALLANPVAPDCDGLLRCIRREGTPARVYFIELFLDPEIQDALCRHFHLTGARSGDPFFPQRRRCPAALSCYDYVRCGLEGMGGSTAPSPTIRRYIAARAGAATWTTPRPNHNWSEFHAYPRRPEATRSLGGVANLPECASSADGFAPCRVSLADDTKPLMPHCGQVQAIAERLLDIYRVVIRRLLQFERVKRLGQRRHGLPPAPSSLPPTCGPSSA